ncbi:MAG TPA: patatin-like phospholipase family protein [Candidatus Fermentibacter daniensis]|nr:patatin-like phospholipase family protein [Candidatus Fermentibacter daniensis]HPK52354.1 patatin-like phospholipase family protein [Candidatus Fermentibacter daniensis]
MIRLLILSALLFQVRGYSVVLSGGGARGLAHIGVLRAFEERGVPVKCVAGTSMGALVAGLYASGWSAAQIDSIARSIDWDYLFSSAPDRELSFLPQRLEGEMELVTLGMRGMTPVLPASAISTQRLVTLLVSLTSFTQLQTGDDFDNLPVPVRMVAFDLESRSRVVLESGSLPDAMLSSMAFPAVFPAVRSGGMLLVDGGVVDNMPVDIAAETWELPVIAVDISPERNPAPERPTLLEAGTLTLEALTKTLNDSYRRRADYTVRPALGNAAMWDFKKADSLIRAGYEAGCALLDSYPELTARPFRRLLQRGDAVRLDNVLLGGLTRLPETAVFPWLGVARGDTLTPASLRREVEILFASGLFNSVRPELSRIGPGRAGLTFHLEERDPAEIGIGLAYRNELGLEGRLGLRTRNFLNTGGRASLGLGGSQGYVFAELSVTGASSRSRSFRQLSLTGWQMCMPAGSGDGSTCAVENRFEAELANGLSLGWFGVSQIGAGFTARHSPVESWTTFWRAFIRGMTQTWDNPMNPRRGSSVRMEFSVSPLKPVHQVFDLDAAWVTPLGRRSSFGIDGWTHLSAGEIEPWQFTRLSVARSIPGHPWNSAASRERLVLGAVFSQDFKGPFFASVRGVGAWDWETPLEPGDGSAIWGAGLSIGARTPAGPVSISWGIGSGDRTSWTVGIGRPQAFGPGR